ncbi:MAG TPA: hypothetical protein VET66_13550 [Steroidobacteraceae bacterium]|nr:hypothetical protein [Steroidobacteraceae bacterium]
MAHAQAAGTLVFDGDHLAPPAGHLVPSGQNLRDFTVRQPRGAGAVESVKPTRPALAGAGLDGRIADARCG